MRNLFPSSIRSKLILLGVLAFLPVVLLTVFNSWNLRRLEAADAKERMAKILDFAILHEEEVVREAHRILATLAEVPNLLKGGKPASEVLVRLLKNSPEYTNFAVAGPDGHVIASAVPLLKALNFSDRPYFQDVLKSKSFAISQYLVGRITGKPIVVFGYPVLDRQGNVAAVLIAPLDLSRVTRFEAEIAVQTPASSSYVKLDRHGNVLTAYPDAQVFGKGHPLEKSLFDRISEEKKGTFQVAGADGVERLYLFASYQSPMNKEGGFVLLGIPTKALFAGIDRQLAMNLTVLALIAVLFLAIMRFGGNSMIARPAGNLVDASKRLAAGDLAARSGIGSIQGEFGQLGRAFDEMAEEIQRRQDDSRRIQETLRESETRYRSIFDSSADGIVIVDPETATPIEFNEQACTQLGYTREEFGRLKISDIDLLEGTEEVKAHIRKIMSNGYDEFETVHRTQHGKQRNMHVKAQYISVGGKSVYHCIWRDITEQKRAEAEKERLQAQLQQAMKMEAVGRLAGGVAHDFNNLLTVITGYSELLLQKIGKESPMHREVEEIQRAGERAASLTQQLLAFSRKQIIEPKVLQLDSLVAEMHKMLTRLIGEDISLQAITGRSLGSVKVDPGQIQQILMNLVVNARDAMPDGGKITIETGNVDLGEGYCALHPYVTPGRFVMLAVSDTGKGMSEEVKAQIFEPFFTTKERGSGTGLGLATTYGAVKQAGGSIEVYSEVGIGTTLRIYLPRIEEEAVKPEKVDRRSNLPGGTETVLLVEDEETLRTLCERILGELGYTVLPAGNGAEAIALARKYGDRIDLLLTDVVMPGMNGSELATQLVLHHPEMKVLFMSGYTDDAITRHGVLDEGVSFIGKPFTPAALARKVREVLDKA